MSGCHPGRLKSILLLCQFLNNVLGEVVFDFTMARHRLTCASIWILIPIMPTSMTDENATEFFNLVDQLFSLHAI